mmetsp:Transcript_29125/g.21669  ORF Transcript_29125/g.21669 Transcript_29125/m.21669 type:complete len:166 (-) Transcript_29125:63-560(-)|eukprot:CAMPEP_0202963402 /NCGR_PEP_ID=MMETSP1396-20130829/7387_1 /ASSEMBLY_ACC=CAM_ASM_000872 /TAXON_ID= /ORGANISM="Pseudokeronopsis sp., Strain Brazil" /LENGTH=165 /DNA_ID=CAMNT_0049684571 /DNA_START=340 /DNA_END=837 /DNA_ORIENTATION=-
MNKNKSMVPMEHSCREESSGSQVEVGKQDRPSELRSKIVEGYLRKLLDKEELHNQEKINVVKKMYELNVDNRILNNLRQTMNSLIVDEKGFFSVQQFKELFMSAFKSNFKSKIIYDLLLPQIQEGDNVIISKLSAFIDFFNFLPIAVQRDKNSSQELYFIMKSNL